ncbi:putative ATP-dependent RNA helicase DDX11 [Brachionus plicatilis]|uniref:Putative ATP-dependent RNA helicase DDX11 n=1 Tax=Brachionus plicatilis TaxID=10195 RepID=A0A3M7PP05_BRAPC|nr:putative ATP-dependent RNA helicase DDX11 [Brachionus plicatilis]
MSAQNKKILQVKSLNGQEKPTDSDIKLSDELDLILDDYISDDDDFKEFDDEETDNDAKVTKIYFCSRTHSQISQFIGELKKTIYSDTVRVVTLGSRMVINFKKISRIYASMILLLNWAHSRQSMTGVLNYKKIKVMQKFY